MVKRGQNRHTGSGSQEDPLRLEYAEDDRLSLGLSYHLPTLAQEEPLLVFGSLVSQSPSDVSEVSCACPVSVHIFMVYFILFLLLNAPSPFNSCS